MSIYENLMRTALSEAINALEHDDVPVGAIVVKDDRIIAGAHNKRYLDKDATAHAEIIAIKQACAFFNTQFLDGCDIYVTCEPCLMCAGAIIQARIKNLYFGAYDKKAGCAGSVLNVFDTRFNHVVNVNGGILQEECSEILTSYFKKKRRKSNDQT